MDIVLQILGLAYFIFALWNLRLAVLFLPLFFSAYLLKFDLIGVPFPMIEVFIYGTFLAWVLQTFLKIFQRKLSWKECLEPYKKIWWLAILGIMVAAIISTFIAPQSVMMMDGTTIFYGKKVALGILKSWIIAPILMLVLFAGVVRSAKDLKIAVQSYVVSAVFLAGWGIYQVLTKQYLTPDMRASGPFNSANYLALFITPALFYALVRVKEFFTVDFEEPWWKKVFHIVVRKNIPQRPEFFLVMFWAVALLVLFFGLLFTKSYAAFLTFFVACCLWFYFQMKNWKGFSWKIVGLVAVVLMLIVFALIALDPAKWQTFFQLATRSSSGVRVQIYTIAAHLVLANPILGIGLGMFPAAYQLQGPQILGQPLYELNMLHPHDLFLAFWLNLGLLGFLSFLWILKVCFKRSWKYVKSFAASAPQSVEWFHAIGFFMLVIILVHGFVDTPFFKNDLALLFWLVVSLMVLPSSKKS